MTLSKILYKYLSFFIASIILISNFKIAYSSNLDMEKLMNKAIDFSSISFGFLLTILALLLQHNGPALQRITNAGRFPDLIKSNKRAVLASAFLAVLSLIFIALKLYESKDLIGNIKGECKINCVKS